MNDIDKHNKLVDAIKKDIRVGMEEYAWGKGEDPADLPEEAENYSI